MKEGNYLEPDRKWQDAYLKTLLETRKEMNNNIIHVRL
jgi:hypothetical protein